jgi:hypothetical protein
MLGGFTRMELEQPDPSWKAQLRYGKIQTPFHHFTALAEGTVGELADGFECPPGSAFMGMKTWALSADESADMIRVIGGQIGFTVTGDIQITRPSHSSRREIIRMDMTSHLHHSSQPPNHTRLGRRDCNLRVPCAGSLSLGRSSKE